MLDPQPTSTPNPHWARPPEARGDIRRRASIQLPILRFLEQIHDELAGLQDGTLADYIPELTKVNPAHFGIAIATVDGHVHAIGDSDELFTIQSVSKAFVFGLVLECLGAEPLTQRIGVEPSGDAFNSIRLRADNRPFNPMVNAGAIACTGLLVRDDPAGAFECILTALSRFAGRDLAVDESVYRSERDTGDRNRAIAWLLRNNGILEGDVDTVLDVYFRQCSVLVSARDLAVMGATLAANGVNPLTGEQILSPATVARALSVMVSSGMYDYSGEWLYRVGLPAKSGVGGGIVAALPAQLGLGTFSPRLDPLGNSVRGLKVCESLSAHFGLHLLNRSGDVYSSIAADYDLSRITSARDRSHTERAILVTHGAAVRVLELRGSMNFVDWDYVSRLIAGGGPYEITVFDMRRVASLTMAAARLLRDLFAELAAKDVRVVLSSVETGGPVDNMLSSSLDSDLSDRIRRFAGLEEAAGWAEDQIIFLYGGFNALTEAVDLAQQPLMAGLSNEELALVADVCSVRTYKSGQLIVTAGDPGDSLYFIQKGMASAVLNGGTRVASLGAGTCFGELVLLAAGTPRSTNVVADTQTTCLCLALSDYEGLCDQRAGMRETVLHNLSALLAERLRKANAKMEVLSRGWSTRRGADTGSDQGKTLEPAPSGDNLSAGPG